MARQGLLDPVIGRHQEVRRLMQVLCRRVKNNPVLIGQPGVGKTAIVEGLAQRMAQGDVPELLRGKELFVLDLSTMVAGAEYRGALEERTKGILSDIRGAGGDVILFIDELHSIVRASGGSFDISGMLKPALAGGQLRCIGVTSLDEYRNYIEKDSALERRFQSILVEEPTVEETVSILRGIRSRYEAYHDIRISDAALVAAANLSHRFIADRSLPDKAIDLIDEAASKVSIEWDSMPVDVDSTGRHIAQMESELKGLPPFARPPGGAGQAHGAEDRRDAGARQGDQRRVAGPGHAGASHPGGAGRAGVARVHRPTAPPPWLPAGGRRHLAHEAPAARRRGGAGRAPDGSAAFQSRYRRGGRGRGGGHMDRDTPEQADGG